MTSEVIKRTVMARGCAKSLDLNLKQSGGYDYDFVDEVPERLTCQICFKPFRDPHLVVCCGKHYCGSCLTTSFRILSVKIKAVLTAAPKETSSNTSITKVSKAKLVSLKSTVPSGIKAANGSANLGTLTLIKHREMVVIMRKFLVQISARILSLVTEL